MGKKYKETMEQVLNSMLNVSLPVRELITRKQIAEMAGVRIYKVDFAANLVALKFPRPVGKDGHQYLYEKPAVIDWLSKNSLSDIRMTDQFAAKIGGRRHTGLDEGLATAFIRGACAPLCIKRQNGRRRRRAQLNQAKSQRVHVHEAPNEPEALRSGLVRQTDSDGVTFASLSGNSRQLY